jgi:hypothetical protein
VARLKLRSRPKAKGSPPPKELTLEEIRERYDLGTEERAIAELKFLGTFKVAARDVLNAENRQKTQARKALKALVAGEVIDLGDEIHVGEKAYSFDFAKSESVDRKALYALVKKGDVSIDDFLKCIYVNKEMASKLIGDHILLKITKTETGKNADIRSRDLDRPVERPRIVKKPLPPASKTKLDRSQDFAAPVANVSSGVRRFKRRRTVNVG